MYQTLHEVLQEPYNDGIGAGRGALMRIDYRPYGFSVGRVLNGDFSDIPNSDEIVVGRYGAAWPEKLSIHLMVRAMMFCVRVACSQGN